jgi:hypothetical protein
MSDWPFRLPEPPDGFEQQALAAHTTVEYERGQWVVYVEFRMQNSGFRSSVQRSMLRSYECWFWVLGSGFSVLGSGFSVLGSGF